MFQKQYSLPLSYFIHVQSQSHYSWCLMDLQTWCINTAEFKPFIPFFSLSNLNLCCIIFVFCFQYLYHNEDFEKPFFSTYVKTSMFTLYLLGLCFWPPWRDQCSKPATYMVCSFCYNKKFISKCAFMCVPIFFLNKHESAH